MQAKFISGAEAAPAAETAALPHRLVTENRSGLTATGVTRILSYDENGASLETRQGGLVIGGSGLEVSELSIQSGEVRIRGRIDYIQYTDRKEPAAGFFKRWVR